MKKSRNFIISKENCPCVSFHKRIVYVEGTGPRHPHKMARTATSSIEVDCCPSRMMKKCLSHLNENSETTIKGRNGQIYVVRYRGHKSEKH